MENDIKIKEYFNNDDLAYKVYKSKYKYKDENPEDTFNRVANEYIRIENNYDYPIDSKLVKSIVNPKTYLPAGSQLFGIGTDHLVSLSNCFGVDSPDDSYSGIHKTDEEISQIFKRRGGVGFNLNSLRPKGATVNNSANSSSGAASFAARYSNTTLEVAQEGRRGALMLMMNIKHPDCEEFMDLKTDTSSITGANCSIQITDGFIDAVKNNNPFIQTYPIDSIVTPPENYELDKLYFDEESKTYYKVKDAKLLWNKIIHNAWKYAEPGVLYWDTIKNNSASDDYIETVTTNPCFTGDMRILTSKGYKKFNEIVGTIVEIEVSKGRYLLAVIKKSGYKECIRVTMSDEESEVIHIECTPDHKFDVNGEWVEAKDLYHKNPTSINLTKNYKVVEITEIGYHYVYDFTVDTTTDEHYGYVEGIKVHNCGEVPLSAYDSCRLSSINLTDFVINPWTKDAKFDFDKLQDISKLGIRLMDDMIDLEMEKIKSIISVLDEKVNKVEIELWSKVLLAAQDYRRCGLGITGLADVFAMMNITYGSEESKSLTDVIFTTIAKGALSGSIYLAKVRGAFPKYDYNTERDNEYLNKILNLLPKNDIEDYKEYGRRNIGLLTIAPNGSLGIISQTSSGIEPVFSIKYQRTSLINGVSTKFNVYHPKFLDWYMYKSGVNMKYDEVSKELDKLSNDEWDKVYKSSPYYLSTAQDINWLDKVVVQGVAQKWIDHSISCTVNIPEDSTEELVSKIYETAYDVGCKGCTIYRQGSREGVLTTGVVQLERPDVVDAVVYRFKNNSENWIAFIGLMNNKPYEIFTGKFDQDMKYLPKSITKGKIVRVEENNTRRYDFKYEIDYGIINTLPAINYIFNKEYWNYARIISGMLRLDEPIDHIINIIRSMHEEGNSISLWRNGVARALQQFVPDGTISKSKCTECGSVLVYQGGCSQCINCGNSKCD